MEWFFLDFGTSMADLLDFSSLPLSSFLLKALEQLEFHAPTPIQAQSIPILLAGQDLIAQAQTGTGKTAAFALPILNNLDPQLRATQALILAPTRELAIQVSEQFQQFSQKQPIVISTLCGGQDYRQQLQSLKKGAQIVVGTPGRILDHIQRKSLHLDHLKTFILDEADEMLRMGFIEDVETILKNIPEKKQMALFSATMPSQIRQIAQRYLHQPLSVTIPSETATVKNIQQYFIWASGYQKKETLLRILAVEPYQSVIVFVRTKSSTEEVASHLQEQGIQAMALHGDFAQALRERILNQFRQGIIKVLIATDVAARGLDVEQVTHVINYDVPYDCETYVHRIGRTGRAGRDGAAILLLSQKESRLLGAIEHFTKQKMKKLPIPSELMIQNAKQAAFMARIEQSLKHPHLETYFPLIEQFSEEKNISSRQLAAAMALLMHQERAWLSPSTKQDEPARTWEDEKNSEIYYQAQRNPRHGREERPFREERSFYKNSGGRYAQNSEAKHHVSNHAVGGQQVIFRVNIGKAHGIKPNNIVGAIANEGGIQSRFIRDIKIHQEFSLVSLPQNISKTALQKISKAWVCGRQLKLQTVS